jgi:hypothetical protein
MVKMRLDKKLVYAMEIIGEHVVHSDCCKCKHYFSPKTIVSSVVAEVVLGLREHALAWVEFGTVRREEAESHPKSSEDVDQRFHYSVALVNSSVITDQIVARRQSTIQNTVHHEP